MKLCRNDTERAQIVDMSRRLGVASRLSVLVLILAGVLAVPTFGWLMLAPGLVAAAVFTLVRVRLDRYRRPEVALAATWVLVEVMVVAMIVLARTHSELLYPLFVFPTLSAAVVWPRRWVVVTTALTAAALTGIAFATNLTVILATPPVLTHQLAFVVSTALIASAARETEVASRSSALIDQLTGALTRPALDVRARELEHQSRLSSRGVALIVADIDRFKQINDRHGHGAGDEVLREVAYKLAKALPAFAPLYRFGGEEFVTLLPDTELQAAVDIAERMRASLAGETTAGYPVTASFGVAAGVPGQPFELDAVFAQADRALYEAKRSGRNRVRASSGGAVAALRPARGRDRRAGIERTPGPDAYGAVAGPASAAPTAGDGSSWLANPLERQHLLDMTRRWLHAKPFPYLVAFAAIIFLGPWFGWWPILPVVLGSVVYRGVEERLEGMRRPELAYLMAWLLNQTGNALAYVVSHTPAHSPHPYSSAFALPLLILMIVPASSVLPARGVVICTVYTALLMLAVALSLDTTLLTQRPTEVAFSFALLVSVATVGCAVGRSAVHHRGVALVDRLTGLLNRRALELRTVELAQQARATRQPVAVLIGDLDRFKTVNDHHGHAAGDRALAAAAERLRSHLRGFDGVYRFGGEEFAIVLAGATSADAIATAERLRQAIAAEPMHDLPLTMSFGVAATAAGEPFEFEALFAEADAALLSAKNAGRNRVCASGEPVSPRVARAA